jgi:hypothetical protein
MALKKDITVRGVITTYHIILSIEADKIKNSTRVKIGSFLDKDARTASLNNFIPTQYDYTFMRVIPGVDLTFAQIYEAIQVSVPQTIIDTPEVLDAPQWTDTDGNIHPAVEGSPAITHIVEMNEFAGSIDV